MRTAPESGVAARAPWTQYRERGSGRLLRIMSWLSLRYGRRATRPLLHVITLYFLVFAPTACRHSRDYLQRVLRRAPTLRDRYRHLLSFASTIHDRIYLVNGQLGEFDIELQGVAHLDAAIRKGSGALLMGAHLGSFEMIGAVGQLRAGLTVAMAMYEENARKVNAMLNALNPALRTQIIALGRMDAMLQMKGLLDTGAFVGMLADRTPGAEPTHRVSLLGVSAALPIGPMRAAALLRRPVIFMAGLYLGGNRYRVVFEPLADFSVPTAQDRDTAVRAAVERYAQVLEGHCRSAPYNWFNFFDFWRTPR